MCFQTELLEAGKTVAMQMGGCYRLKGGVSAVEVSILMEFFGWDHCRASCQVSVEDCRLV